VLVIAVTDVRDPFEAGSEAAPHLILADEAAPPGIRPSGGFKDAVLCEVGHDGVQVMPVEGVQDVADDFALPVVVHGYLLRGDLERQRQHSRPDRVNRDFWERSPASQILWL
jgi:hypothetical protein